MRQPVVQRSPVELVILDHLEEVEEPGPAVVQRVGHALLGGDDGKHLGVVGSAGKEVRDHETSGNTAVAYQKQSEIKIMSCLR